VVVGPKVDQVAGELGAIVDEQAGRGSPLPDEAVQDRHDVLAPELLANLDGQTLPAEHVDHGQGAKRLPVAELVVDEVEAPRFVQSVWLATRFAVHDHLAAPRPLGPQRQPFLAVEPPDQVLPTVQPSRLSMMCTRR
jgi:hypothetical protein